MPGLGLALQPWVATLALLEWYMKLAANPGIQLGFWIWSYEQTLSASFATCSVHWPKRVCSLTTCCLCCLNCCLSVNILCHHCRTDQLYTDAKALAGTTTNTQILSTHLTHEKGKNLFVSHLLETLRGRCDSCVRVIWSWSNSSRFKNHLPFLPKFRMYSCWSL